MEHFVGLDVSLCSRFRTKASYCPKSEKCRYCCKSRFAQAIKNSAGCRRVFGVKMWGDRPSRVKLTGDFGNAIEGIRISNHLPLLVFAKNSWRCNFRLLQHYPLKADVELRDLCRLMMPRCTFYIAPKMDTLDFDADVEGEKRERDGRMMCSDKR